MNSNFFDLSKRKKRDLLTELLVGSAIEGIISKKELNALNKVIQSAPAKNRTIKSNTQSGTKKVSAPRKKQKKAHTKTTFYLSENNIKKLDKAQSNIRSPKAIV